MMHWCEVFFLAVIVSTTASNVNNQPHCKSTEPSCYHQITFFNATKGDCSVRRIESNSARCRDFSLRTNGDGDLGYVVLHHYLFKTENLTYFTTGLNITFSKIKWTRLRMQYKDRANDSFNFCREFNLNARIKMPMNTSLFYDCLWSVNHEDKEFDFKYEAFDARRKTTMGRHYILKVPRHYNMLPQKPLNVRPVFMYIDISELPLMRLHWEVTSNVTEFEVSVYQDGKLIECKRMSGPPNKFEQYTYSYNVGFRSSKIHFSVEIIDQKCNGRCQTFNSPIISIAESVSNQPLLIGIIGSVVVLPVILYSLYIWKRYSLLAVGTVPTVLLVYRRSLITHTRAVLAFAKYLRTCCRVNALIDELDIPLTISKDPHAWYQEAFSRADVVLVISSPPHTDSLEEGVYQKVDLLALRILSEKYCDTRCKQKLISLLLPYCSRDDIPMEAKHLKCYSFKKDWNEFLWNLSYGLKSFWIPKIDYLCYQSQIPGGDSDLRRHGKFLLDALQSAEEDVQRRNFPKGKIVDDANLENVPLRECVRCYSDSQEASEFSSLKNDGHEEFCDAPEVYSKFPGDLHTMNLLGTDSETETCTEMTNSAQRHNQIDLDSLVL